MIFCVDNFIPAQQTVAQQGIINPPLFGCYNIFC